MAMQLMRSLLPPGVKPRTKVRLKGMGIIKDKKPGNLYLDIKVES
jgi:DnaJ-class molecular chaperone